METAAPHRPPLDWLYVGSIFASAFLLFLIQPLVARMILPRFGGTPAVWNTALVFFQCLLLAGYAYAHFSQRLLGPRRQLLLQVALIALPLLVLPPAGATVARQADTDRPEQSVMLTLAALVGLPFFALASNSSLVQRWYSLSGLAGGDRPYRLYAASNLGSMLALLAYPLLVEPLWGLDRQAGLWSLGYGLFAGLTLAVMGYTMRAMSARAGPLPPARGSTVDGPVEPLGLGRRLGWVARAAIAVSLLMGTTMRITTDIAPVPLLWIIPLALYLATFILAFGRPGAVPRRALAAGSIACVTLTLFLMLLPGTISVLALVVGLPLATLGTGALLCHDDIARDQPAPAHLTEYYLWISAGGALGGILNSLVAPVLFSSVAEYPITLVLLVVAAILSPGAAAIPWQALRRPAALGLGIGMTAAAVWSAVHIDDPPSARWRAVGLSQLVLMLGLAALWIGERRRRTGARWVYAYAAALAAALVVGGFARSETVVDQARSFFGVLRVVERGETRALYHGAIMHGSQGLDPARRRLPGLYYHPSAPLGRLVLRAAGDARLGLVGLGTGALAALCTPGQALTFYEIDPLVPRMARAHFTFLGDAACRTEVVIGDGRLRLAEAGDQGFDVLIVDAFSSDAIPIHLLTTEALALYRQKLDPHGIIGLHISNRYIDLVPVVAAGARATGLAAAEIAWQPDEAARAEGAASSKVVALSPDPAVIERLIREEPGWRPIDAEPEVLWTDDHAGLWRVLRW